MMTWTENTIILRGEGRLKGRRELKSLDRVDGIKVCKPFTALM